MPIAPVVGAALIGGAAAIGGGVIASSGSRKAGELQAQAGRDAQAAQDRRYEDQKALQEPFRQAGLTAQNEIMQLLGIGGDKAAAGYGSLGKSFGMADFERDPGAEFRQSESLKALERSAAARGNLLSGSTLKGVQRFSQDLASQEYQNAFNRYQVERAAKLNPLQSLMGSGQSAANVLTTAAGQAGQNQAANIYNTGQARASGYIGQANALATALGQVGGIASSYPQNQAIIDYYKRTPSGTGGFGGTPSTAPFSTPPYGPTTKTPWGVMPGGLGPFS
jgi:hypothetical protein